MSRFTLLFAIITMVLLGYGLAYAQTTLIDPNGDGGFETGTTFTANGWTEVNNNNNNYQIGSAPSQYAGSRCAFISKNDTQWQNQNGTVYRHIYRNVSFPSGETEITLSFYYKVNTTQTTIIDGFTIRLVNTTVTPTIAGYPSGVLLYPSLIATETSWALFQVSIPAENAGTTKRLVFSWYNNNSNPRTLGALDNISLISQVPTTINSLPYTQNFDSTSVYRLPVGWTTLNSNTDSKIWYNQTQVPNSSPNAMLIYTNGTSTSNDWLVSAPISLQSGIDYYVNFAYRAGSSSYNEKLQLRLASSGTAAALASGTQLFNNSSFNSVAYTSVTQHFTVPSSGTYYFGWQAYSAASQLGIVIDDVSIEQAYPEPGVSETALAFGVTDLTSGSSPREFRFYNIGYGVITLQGMAILGGNSDQFTLVDSNTYPVELEHNEFISVQVSFTPTYMGAKSSNLYIQDNLGKNLYSLPLSGHAANELFRDGFESNTNFNLTLTNWTQYDGDHRQTVSFSDVSYTNEGYTGSFIAFNPSTVSPDISAYWPAYNGAKYAACMSVNNITSYQNKDWLISKALVFGNNPVISFYAKSIANTDSLMRFKVLYSTTGNNYTNFTNYLAGSGTAYVRASANWTNYTYVLPSDCANTTVYIAIQCVSKHYFSFQVDDFVAGDYGSPQFYVSPTNYEFPEFFINYTRSKQFTIANNGGGTMQIVEGGISFSSGSSPYFKLKDLPALPLTLNGGESTTFSVTYNSDREATHSATLSIIDNLSKATHTVALSGITTDNTITQKPYMEGFEPSYEGGTEFQVKGWVRRDSDADGYNWLLVNSPTMAKSGNWLAASQSWVPDAKNASPSLESLDSKTENELLSGNKSQRSAQAKGALTPSNWLISPPVTISAGDSLSYWIGGYHSTDYAEHYSLVASLTTPEPDQFTTTLLEETLTTEAWRYRAISLGALDGQTIYFAFRHYNCTDQLALRIDDVKVKANNTEIYQDYVGDPVEGNNYFKITMQQEIQDENYSNALLVVAEGWLSAASTALVNGSVGYGEPQQYIENAGLTVQISGVSLSGARLRITHNLDFIPLHLAYRTTEGSYGFILPAQASVWSATQVDFTVPSLKAGEGLELVFPKSAEATLPVELSTFAVSISAYNKVQVLWVSQSETGLLGYRVYRGKSDDFSIATQITPLIPATNTSQQQTYLYEDKELNEAGFYYYWLEHQELAGDCHLHGPVTINFSLTTDGTPEIPVVNGFSSIYPNPFNPATRIRYGLEQKSDYSLKVYNLKGQVVRTLELGSKDKGYYTADWNGRDDNNSACSSGVYFFVLRAGTQSWTRKAILAK